MYCSLKVRLGENLKMADQSEDRVSQTQSFGLGTGVTDGNSSRMLGAKVYKRKGIVYAQMSSIPLTFRHDWGKQEMPHGAFIIVDPGNDDVNCRTWMCERTTFVATYEPVPDMP
jgi:hypothetical protein